MGAKRESCSVWLDVTDHERLSSQSLESSKRKTVGEPDEGKPHVRFEVAGDGNLDMVKL